MKKILLIVTIIIAVFNINKYDKEEVVIPNDSIRFRIIQESNIDFDIEQKKQLKAFIESKLYELTKNSNNSKEVDKIIKDNFEYINQEINLFLGNDNYTLDYGINYFPAKTYKGVIYEPGLYNSLVITLGNGKGDNWWCVLFPPLCLLEENMTTKDVEYQFFISRIIKKYI